MAKHQWSAGTLDKATLVRPFEATLEGPWRCNLRIPLTERRVGQSKRMSDLSLNGVHSVRFECVE